MANMYSTRLIEIGGKVPLGRVHTTRFADGILQICPWLTVQKGKQNRLFFTEADRVGRLAEEELKRSQYSTALLISETAKVVRQEISQLKCSFKGEFPLLTLTLPCPSNI